VTVSAATAVTATFKATNPLSITLASSGQGTVTSQPTTLDCGATCSGTSTAQHRHAVRERGGRLSGQRLDGRRLLPHRDLPGLDGSSAKRHSEFHADGRTECQGSCSVSFDSGTTVTLTGLGFALYAAGLSCGRSIPLRSPSPTRSPSPGAAPALAHRSFWPTQRSTDPSPRGSCGPQRDAANDGVGLVERDVHVAL
jgi:hypothetical protein